MSKCLEGRFWEKVQKLDDKDCWPWTSARTALGYGRIRVNHQALKAHRVVWELTQGPIPDGLCVLHHCDNPACVNPKHLFLGTQRDNMRDSSRKGRLHFGESNGMAKLTQKQVGIIRRLKGRYSGHDLAEIFGVRFQTVYKIWNGERWRDKSHPINCPSCGDKSPNRPDDLCPNCVEREERENE